MGDPATADANFDLQLVEFELALDPYSGAVASSSAHDRFGARFSFDTESVNPVQVLEEALDVFHDAAVEAGLPAWQVVRCEILTYAEDDARDGADDEE